MGSSDEGPIAVDGNRVTLVEVAAIVGADWSSGWEACVFSSVLDRSSAFDPGFAVFIGPVNCLSPDDGASLVVLFDGKEDISRGVDGVRNSDCG